MNEPNTERTRSERRSPVQNDARLVTALEERIASLERQLDERTEEIRRRDHIIAGLVERVKELPTTTESVPVAHETAPRSDDLGAWVANTIGGLIDRLRAKTTR